MKNADMPAMPTIANLDRDQDKFYEKQVSNNDYMLFGLTKREHFAGLAMQGMISAEYGAKVSPGQWAKDALEAADALLAELENQNDPT